MLRAQAFLRVMHSRLDARGLMPVRQQTNKHDRIGDSFAAYQVKYDIGHARGLCIVLTNVNITAVFLCCWQVTIW